MKAQRLGTFSISSLVVGFGFLYIPMLILVIYSFNASRLVTVWAGFSTKWYVELFQDQQLLDAAWMSLKIAFLTACMSLVMGMLASLALVRLGRFRPNPHSCEKLGTLGSAETVAVNAPVTEFGRGNRETHSSFGAVDRRARLPRAVPIIRGCSTMSTLNAIGGAR